VILGVMGHILQRSVGTAQTKTRVPVIQKPTTAPAIQAGALVIYEAISATTIAPRMPVGLLMSGSNMVDDETPGGFDVHLGRRLARAGCKRWDYTLPEHWWRHAGSRAPGFVMVVGATPSER